MENSVKLADCKIGNLYKVKRVKDDKVYFNLCTIVTVNNYPRKVFIKSFFEGDNRTLDSLRFCVPEIEG